MKKIKGILALSRWFEVYDFNLVVSFLGAILAGGWIGWRLVLIIIANFLGLTFAFMINDVEDSEEDSHNEKKRKRNPISNGTLTKKEGHLISTITLVITFVLYFILTVMTNNFWVIIVGIATLLISFLYSWRKVRLKGIPIIDFLSHMFMLSGAQFLIAYLSFRQSLDLNGAIVLSFLMIISCYGELDNEIRDLETDIKTKIRTTAVVLGKKLAVALQILFLVTGGIIIFYVFTNAKNPWPILLQGLIITAVLMLYPIALYFKENPFAKVKNEIQRMIVMSAYINFFLYLIHFRII